jgi:hypothetical protein
MTKQSIIRRFVTLAGFVGDVLLLRSIRRRRHERDQRSLRYLLHRDQARREDRQVFPPPPAHDIDPRD